MIQTLAVRFAFFSGKRPGRRLRQWLLLAGCCLLASCAAFSPPTVSPGELESAIVARMGRPTAIYQDGSDRLLEYRTNPGAQFTWMYRIGQDGRAKGMEQVLTTEKFATIRVGADNKQDVLRKIGAPYETSYLSLPDLEVWSYMYLENGVWDSLMHVHFDRSGTVRKLENAPDLTRRPNPGEFFR